MMGRAPRLLAGRRAGRSPGFVFVVMAAVLLALVATAFTPAQPPPPPTAEYAPEAAKPIKTAPPQQTSQLGKQPGEGSGGTGPGHGAGPTPTPTPSTSPTPGQGPPRQAPPSLFHCVGDPARQTEDPESPPCVTLQVADNGGATTTGVDANTIRIAVPNNPDARQFDAFVKYFNARFNFYGRRLVVVDSPGCYGGGTPQEMKATADSIAQKQVFAVVGYCDAKGTEYPFFDELAAKKVVSVANRPGIELESQMAAHHPYEWTFWDTFDVGQTHVADLACALAGQPASHAGAALSRTPRKFGLFYNTFADAPSMDTTALRSTLKACGVTLDPKDVAGIAIDRNGGAGGQGYSSESVQQVQSALLKMQADGVTTLIDLVHGDTAKQIFQVASAQSYEPEHLVSSWLYLDFDESASSAPADQQPHIFGISAWNRFIHVPEEYWYQAIKEGDPSYPFQLAKYNYYNAWWVYYPMLVLAAGIQMAGPHLTPETFAHGLQSTRYPNAIVPGHPEGKVSISPGQHSYISDASIIWFNPAMPDPEYGTSGSYCYADGGRRFVVGHYPADPPLFSGPCGRYG